MLDVCRYYGCENIENEPTYLPDSKVQNCTCLPSINGVPDDLVRRKSDQIIPSVRAHTNNTKHRDNYPGKQTYSNEIVNPPDIANVKSSMDTQSENNYYSTDVEFIRKQPDILQSSYYGNQTSPLYPEHTTCNYLSTSSPLCMYGHNLDELRKKSCSLPKSFQRNDGFNKDFKMSTK